MNYEQWRISFQSSEQAARSAYNMALECRKEIDAMSRTIDEQQKEIVALSENKYAV